MYRHHVRKKGFRWSDLLILSLVAGLIYGMMGLFRYWAGSASQVVEINLAPDALPKYAFFSLIRAVGAYLLSLGFSLIYGYVAAKLRRGERVLIPLLDILQSVPVFGFLPSLVLGLSSIFPNSNIGIELACVFMIFTSQAWNMTFSFYTSVRSVPPELTEVTRLVGLSWWERFKRLELPFSAIGLAWNSLMSMAGGWFFLTVCESFKLGDKEYRLPGIGSYMAEAIEKDDHRSMLYGIVTMSLLIVFVDFILWRPVMAWVRKFQMEEIQEDVAELPFVSTLLRDSFLLRFVRILFRQRERIRTNAKKQIPVQGVREQGEFSKKISSLWNRIQKSRVWSTSFVEKAGISITIVIALWAGTRIWELVRDLDYKDWFFIWKNLSYTAARVFGAVILGAAWSVPLAIFIGRSQRLTRIFQPVIQVVASFPAPMLYPLIIGFMLKFGVGIEVGASILMMAGVQWYVLFNVMAGAVSITRDLKDTMVMMGASQTSMWKNLYLPAIFPSLVTGLVTAAGGAWNASIVAEYVFYKGNLLTASGIGALISQYTVQANYPMLAACLIVMVFTVVGLNQSLWRWLAEVSETRFRFER